MKIVSVFEGRVLAVMAAIALLSGCAPPGKSEAPKFASIGKPINKDFVQLAVVERRLIEVNASGNTVRAPAPEGYCFPKDGVFTSDASAFLLLQTCEANDKASVLSISVSKDGLFGDEGPTEANFAAFEAFLSTQDGARQLGLDAGSGAIFLMETAYRDGALYALARDASGAGFGFSGDFICRAFTEVNGRMAVISMISAKGDQRDPSTLMQDLEGVVQQFRQANQRAGA